jgi:ligand-binding sensor domain-containing protein/DNA-binding CsgD family transcriptional regulator
MLINDEWEIQSIKGIKELNLKGILELNDGSLFLLSEHNGVFIYKEEKLVPWDSPANKKLQVAKGQELTKITDNIYAIATATNGVILLNSDGSVLSNIGIEEGLISNKVQALFVDKNYNLWVGMNKGISLIYTNSPFTRILPDKEQGGIGYGVLLDKDKLYLAADNGVYYKSLENNNNDYIKVKNSDGQAWGLDLVNNKIILSHNRGGFEIIGDEAKQLYKDNGLWSFQEDERSDNKWIIGGYEGVYSRSNSNVHKEKLKQIPGLDESSRFLVQEDKDILWMAHPYRGIFKINRGTNTINLLGAKDGLPSDLHNHVFRVGNQILFCAETGIYNYDNEQNRFIKNTEFDAYFDVNEKIRRLYAAPNGNIWFITSKDVGFLKIEDLGIKVKVGKVIFPFLKSQMNDGFENIYIHDDDNVFISTIKGFIHYNSNRNLSEKQSQSLVLSTLIKSKSEGIQSQFTISSESREGGEIDIPNDLRSIRFDFNVINFNLDREYVYRWRLEGFESKWSSWTDEQTKEYTNLRNGNYVFHLEAKKANGMNLSLAQAFQIQTPWHTSTLAKIFYGLLISLIVYIIFIRNRQQYTALKEQVDQTVQNSKEEIKRLENERIKSELESKKRELISTTMNLVKKNETFLELKNKVKSTLKLISQEEVNAENWEQFMFHFSELNGDFVERLQTQYEKLTPKDIKMCTYLRMNLSTKEISQLLNVTIRAVEASRYRLRKKLNMGTQENLNEFFMRY